MKIASKSHLHFKGKVGGDNRVISQKSQFWKSVSQAWRYLFVEFLLQNGFLSWIFPLESDYTLHIFLMKQNWTRLLFSSAVGGLCLRYVSHFLSLFYRTCFNVFLLSILKIIFFNVPKFIHIHGYSFHVIISTPCSK